MTDLYQPRNVQYYFAHIKQQFKVLLNHKYVISNIITLLEINLEWKVLHHFEITNNYN